MSGRQDPKYDRNTDVLISLIAALANGTGGVIFLTNVDGDNTSPTEKEKKTFGVSLLNLLKTGLHHFNIKSVLLEHFDGNMGDSNCLSWMFILVKMFDTHVLGEACGENTNLIYRVNEDGEIVLHHGHVPHTYTGAVGTAYDQDNAAGDEHSLVSPGHPDSGESKSVSTPETAPEVKDDEIAKMLAEDRPDQLSWTTNTTNWRKNLTVGSNRLTENVDKLIQTSDMLRLNNPMMFTPRLEQFEYLFPSHEAADKVVKDIRNIVGDCKAFGLVSKAWSTSFTNNVSIQCPPHHIVDIFVISDKCLICLFTVVSHTGTTRESQLEYMFTIGRLTKNHLLKGRSVGHDLCVKCFLLSTVTQPYNQPDSTLVIQETMARFFETTDLGFIQESLSAMLLSKDAFFKTVLGEARLYDLSADQT